MALASVRVIPVLLVVVFLLPALVTCAFLSEQRRRFVLDMVDRLIEWTHGRSTSVHE
ncbi:hypothetical protein ACFXKS_35195 [Streptomyces scopuliridis]|uniref:hypothetical protein n=1 Tax=Streptomyces scopuliridis TaxID=452529 RepID=UPI00368A41DE